MRCPIVDPVERVEQLLQRLLLDNWNHTIQVEQDKIVTTFTIILLRDNLLTKMTKYFFGTVTLNPFKKRSIYTTYEPIYLSCDPIKDQFTRTFYS